MKKTIVSIYFAALCIVVHAQTVYIDTGANITASDDVNLVIHSSDLVNNSTHADFSGCIMLMTGSTDNVVTGEVTTVVKQLSINKPGNKIILNSNLQISSKIDFIAGSIDLNGADIILIDPAFLANENENNRLMGDNGGEVFTTTTLDNPNGVNPGNLGVMFTSNSYQGQVTVRRGHFQQIFNGDPFGIKRYYAVDAVNSNYSGTLRFNYFDAELNGKSEPDLIIWSSADEGFSWVNRGSTSKSVTTNYVESTDLTQLERFTLNEPLPGAPYASRSKSFRRSEFASLTMQVLPNPVAGDQHATVKILSEKLLNGMLVIHAANGQAVKYIPIKLSSGINTVPLLTANLSPGAYLISLVVDYEARKSIMFLKQ